MPPVETNNTLIAESLYAGKDDGSFCQDVIKGLSAKSKHLYSKYFYDQEGDRLFQKIMDCQDYYPFDCELEIFSRQTSMLADVITHGGARFDLIELGAGDCTKTIYLLRELDRRNTDFNYQPIDISRNIIDYLATYLPSKLPRIRVEGLNGEYFQMLERAAERSTRRKVVLFLGSNLGNMLLQDAANFVARLRSYLRPGDLALVGLDLKKHPATILAAYNDREGITRDFNLNLLRRINRELNANFDLSGFEHFPVYDPSTGACRSFLISLAEQSVTIYTGDGPVVISFKENEQIFMEISQKYTVAEIGEMAGQASFRTVKNVFDSKHWFVDTIWEAI